ncbi:hypothetical protein PR048_020752 [Dryococelus australis]|uniref:DUF4371 domain-containing protein n=1 Tax=Dryococelus australis TaxID=614101 RepID=A0ABQ9GWB5_9NEOP|nr:hypothetical protein PR048_020752 [Dryococelus australis]
MFSVICDGTQDVLGRGQESICVRWLDDHFVTQEMLSCLIRDVLLRLKLPLACFRGQTCYGAGNMSGPQKGAQALISDEQSCALC